MVGQTSAGWMQYCKDLGSVVGQRDRGVQLRCSMKVVTCGQSGKEGVWNASLHQSGY